GSISEENWADLITSVIARNSWDNVGGPGYLQAVPGALIVVQSQPIQEQIRGFLTALAERGEHPDSLEPIFWPPGKSNPRERRIYVALDEPSSLGCVDRPLREVLADLGQRHHIPLVVLSSSVKAAGVSEDAPVTMKLEGVTLRSLLNILLR